MMKRLIWAGALAVLSGCLSTSTIAANDPQPTGSDAKAVAAIRSVLKDPSSVRDFRIGRPHRAVNNFIHPNSWAVCASFAARNSLGGYTRGNYLVFFQNNRPIDVKGGSDVTSYPECGPLRAVPFN